MFSRRTHALSLEQVARAQHVQAESYLVYSVMSSGEIECSNTLEDALDQALPSQAFAYRPMRQRVYALLLGAGAGERSSGVRGWVPGVGRPRSPVFSQGTDRVKRSLFSCEVRHLDTG